MNNRIGQQIYVARGEMSGLIKIGVSKHPSRRVTALQRTYRESFRLLGSFEANRISEEMVHGLLRPFHPDWENRPHQRWTEIYPASAIMAAVDAYFAEHLSGSK